MQESETNEKFLVSLSPLVDAFGVTPEESALIYNCLRAIVDEDLAELTLILSAFRQCPEDGSLVLSLLACIVEGLAGGHSCAYEPSGFLSLACSREELEWLSDVDRVTIPPSRQAPMFEYQVTFSVAGPVSASRVQLNEQKRRDFEPREIDVALAFNRLCEAVRRGMRPGTSTGFRFGL
jgi:hypothetical protein